MRRAVAYAELRQDAGSVGLHRRLAHDQPRGDLVKAARLGLAGMSFQRRAVQPPPIWVRWALAIVVAAAVIAGVVIAIHRAGPETPTTEAGAEAEVNRVADIAITEDEAPHEASLPAGVAPASALERAIAGDVRRRIESHQLTGPLQRVGCKATGSSSTARASYGCTVRSAGITYPFVAIVDERSRHITWCKVDPPAQANAGPEVPLSASCRT
jgi:hypothetical protein